MNMEIYSSSKTEYNNSNLKLSNFNDSYIMGKNEQDAELNKFIKFTKYNFQHILVLTLLKEIWVYSITEFTQ